MCFIGLKIRRVIQRVVQCRAFYFHIGNCLDDGRWFPDLHISCGQEFLFKGNVRIVEGGKVCSGKSSNIISFHISCGKEFLYKGNVRRSPKYFLCTGIPYYRKYGRRRCNYFFQKSPFLPPLFPHFLWTGIPDHRKWEDWEHTWAVLPVQAPGKDWTACPILILAAYLDWLKALWTSWLKGKVPEKFETYACTMNSLPKCWQNSVLGLKLLGLKLNFLQFFVHGIIMAWTSEKKGP